MATMPVAERMTANEFLALPVDTTRSADLVEGEFVVNHPRPLHNYVVMDLIVALSDWTRAEPRRGRTMVPIDVLLDDRNVFKPDVLWYAEGRVPARDAEGPVGVPDLAVEVRSPSTWRYDIGAKKSAYERHGLPELWLFDAAAEMVLVLRRSRPRSPTFDIALEVDRDSRLESPLLPGFVLRVGDLFPSD